jgi:pilus assembly protein Flp/PilA
MFGRFRRSRDGTTAIEYGLIGAVMAIAIVAAVSLLSDPLSTIMTGIATAMAVSGGGG